MDWRYWGVSLVLAVPCCVGSTGGELVSFSAAAAGPADATEGQLLEFVNDRGWHIVLTRGALHVGALYLNQSAPVSGAQNTSCVLPGTYVAQVTSGLDVDLLSPEPQGFPAPGTGITVPALTGQVWLTQGEVDTVADRSPVLQVVGTADRDGAAFSFTGVISIGSNRVAGTGGSAGNSPICKQRIVSPIFTSVEPRSDGRLILRIDPRLLFTNVEFDPGSSSSGIYAFADDSSDQPSLNLYANLRSSAPYHFEWAR